MASFLCHVLFERNSYIVSWQRSYEQSLSVLKHAKLSKEGMITKSSIMLGLGETDDELKEAMDDLRAIDVDILTLGQYLQVNESESLCHDNLLVENYRRLTASSAGTLEEAVSVLCGESVIIHLLIPWSFSQSCCSQLHFT